MFFVGERQAAGDGMIAEAEIVLVEEILCSAALVERRYGNPGIRQAVGQGEQIVLRAAHLQICAEGQSSVRRPCESEATTREPISREPERLAAAPNRSGCRNASLNAP